MHNGKWTNESWMNVMTLLYIMNLESIAVDSRNVNSSRYDPFFEIWFSHSPETRFVIELVGLISETKNFYAYF